MAHPSCETQCKAASLSHDVVAATMLFCMVPLQLCLKDNSVWVEIAKQVRTSSLAVICKDHY